MNKINTMCTYAYVHGGTAIKNAGRKFVKRINEVKNDESGMEVVAVVLILVVVVALAVIFRKQIVGIFETLWNKIFGELNDGKSNEGGFTDKGKANEKFVQMLFYLP